MSLLATLLAFLVFFSGLVVAQITAPDCNSTWAWSYNSFAQNPCMVRAYMMSTCTGGSFKMWPLQTRSAYAGPNDTTGTNLKLCMCSTVAYSLISACGGCQGGTWITWSEYSADCAKTPPAPDFPNPIPEGTSVPYWALLDPTDENNWDFNKSYAVRGTAGLGPGVIIGPSITSSVSSASVSGSQTGSTTPTAMPIPIGGHGSKAGVITGGIVGGILAISLLVAALSFYRRWRRSQASSTAQPTDKSAGDSYFVYNTPMLSQMHSRASSSRNAYTVSHVPDPQPHGQRVLPTV